MIKQIVIIEDNSTAASLYGAALGSEGFRVEIATAAQAGLDAVMRLRPDLVVLDLMLPDMDGTEVLRRIRATPEVAKVPVVVTSNAYTPARLDGLREAGATQIVTKASMSPKALARVIREIVQRETVNG